MTDPGTVEAAMIGVDAVVHTAYSRHGDDSTAVNVDGAATVAHTCARGNVSLIHISSDVVFSGRPPHPGGYREDDPLDPMTGFTYGMEKAAAERLVREADPSASIVRTTLMYDLEGRSSLEAGIVASARPGSTMSHFDDEFRCPVHVDDVAGGILALLDLAPESRPPVLHLGGPQRLSRAETARRIAPHLGIDPQDLSEASSSSVPGNRPEDLALDSSLARQLLGYSPRSLEEPG